MKQSIIDDQRTSAVHLSTEELQRYSRHLIMPEVTADGQRAYCASVLGDWGPLRHSILRQQEWEQLASLISTPSIFPICSGKYFTGQRTSDAANWNRRETDCATSIRR